MGNSHPLPSIPTSLLEPQGLLTLLHPLDFLTAPRYDWKCFAQHTDDRAVISVVVLVMMEEDTRPYPDAAGTRHSSRHCLVQLHVFLAAETQNTGSTLVTSAFTAIPTSTPAPSGLHHL